MPSVSPLRLGPPDSILAVPLGQHLIAVQWSEVPGAAGYQLERRINLTGPFDVIQDIDARTTTAYSDDTVEPETTYGYRIVAISSAGKPSTPSIVAGARTPPVQGILVNTSPEISGGVEDPDGYTLTISQNGQTVTQTAIRVQEERRFSPLAPGAYQVTLSGVANNCTVGGGNQRAVTVTDQGLATLASVVFVVGCRDPDTGRLQVGVTTTGDSLDTDGYRVTLTGVADDATLPDSLRAFFRRDSVGPQAQLSYASLRPGHYTLALAGVAGNCALTGAATLEFRAEKLDDLAKSFAITCQRGVDPNRPLALTNHWIPASAGVGQHTVLEVGMDLTAAPSRDVAGVQAVLGFDPTAVRLDSAVALAPWQGTFNSAVAGRVTWIAFITGGGISGTTTFARFYFTAVGAAGATTTTATTITAVADGSGSSIGSLVHKVEATFTVGSGGGNQPPVANLGGPYQATVGVARSFNGSGSSDPDGTIAGYAWTFGDGGTGSGVTPSHTYAAAGSYPVTLTVTDNQGSTASAGTTVTVTSGGGNQPPVAQPGGPYTGVTGTAVSFDGQASSDPDGTVASYAWTFGDGATATGPTPTHAYASAGTYTVALTVTDNLGATGTASTSATISGAGTPFHWQGSFGPINPADSLVALTVTLDLSTDIPETPGPEALQSWAVDSLQWDPAVLRYFSFNFGPGGAGSVNPTDANSQGKLIFSGVQPAAQSTGVITIAVIRFKVIGASGSLSTTRTALGPLLGTAATGGFNYRSKTDVNEGSISSP